MKEPIDVQPAVYDASSKVFGDKVYSQLYKAGSDLEGALAGIGAMAGSDPAGMQWAASYDEVARSVHAVLIDVETACLKLAVMLQQTGFNHGMANSASDPTKSAPTPQTRRSTCPVSGRCRICPRRRVGRRIRRPGGG